MDVTTNSSSYRSYKRSRKNRSSLLTKIAPILVTGLGFIATVILVPSNATKKTDARIFTQGLTVQIDRTSPAYAALEDTLAEDTQGRDEVIEARKMQAVAAQPLILTHASEPIAVRVIRENRREDSLLAQERQERLQTSQALLQAISSALPAAPTVHEVINHPVQKISAADLAKLFAPLIHAPAPGPEASAAQSSSRTLASSGPSPAAPAVRSLANNHPASPSHGLMTASLTQQSATAPACLDNANEDVHQVVLSGPLQFTGGIAITSSNDRVIVYRENDEEKAEPGAVWLKDAKYEIFVDQPVGRLVGELRSVSGEVLGRGYLDLACLAKMPPNKYRVDQLAMTIGPVPHGISGRVITAPIASSANPKARVVAVPNAHVQLGQLPYSTMSVRDGQFKEESLVEGSLIIAHADRPGHWGTMAFASVGSAVDLPMFSDQTMRSIVSVATTSAYADERKSFIWGRVTRNGQPVEGAKVDLMTSAEEVKPVYFNAMMMPDASLTETSANGLYAFYPVEPGSHAVQASDGKGITEPMLFPTDEQTVTQANLDLAVTKKAKLRVFDAFKTDWPLAAEVTSAGRKRGVLVPKAGEKSVTFTGGDGALVLDADAGPNYDRIRVVSAKQDHKIDFPMIQSVWLDQIRGAMRLNQQAGTGTIVGLIRGADTYKVSLEDESVGSSTRVVYFDSHGEVTHNPYGLRGGGFVILNMPLGFRTVLIQASGTTKALATTVLVETRVTNVISKTF